MSIFYTIDPMSQYHIHDARNLSEVVSKNVELIITSPPYFDMKDYGPSGQIGYGQAYEEYLSDMEKVLKQCFIVTKDTGSMWLIVDTLKKGGKLTLLPTDLSRAAEKVGWKLQEIIIWKKDRTLPYSRKGEMRNIFEYILFFVKTDKFKYYPRRITEYDLKEWWIKYPERYSTEGKVPTDIWEFPIPVQGSWGKSYVRHFCPLPSKLIDRIIKLCSDEGDTVFDPFAGTGAVLAEAYKLKRRYIGCDLSNGFKAMFERYIATVSQADEPAVDNQKRVFSDTIAKLRLLKLPSAVLRKLRSANPEMLSLIKGVVVERSPEFAAKKNKLWAANYTFILADEDPDIIKTVEELFSKAPFSKYGIEATLAFKTNLSKHPQYEYEWTATHKPPCEFSGDSFPYIGSDLVLNDEERFMVDHYRATGKTTIAQATSGE